VKAPRIASVEQVLEGVKPNRLIPFAQSESMAIMAQRIDGVHTFRHLNESHDEIIFVVAGELDVWTAAGTYTVKQGESITLPRDVEHGDLVGRQAVILVMEGT
jgi:mannose-6-phosphate isomerase-like protein (cupin superfamily)